VIFQQAVERNTDTMSMNKFTDQDYLTSMQYKDASNLNARINLHRKFSVNKQGLMVWIFDHIKILPLSSNILEVGCGPGDLWFENIGDIPRDWNLTLSDLSPGMLEKAKENLRDVDQKIKYRVIDAQVIPVESNNFDAAIANFMLYHVPDRQRGMSEIHRV
jgi:ubiquinone/menaquinone biosynthesis C-methylase UbiE